VCGAFQESSKILLWLNRGGSSLIGSSASRQIKIKPTGVVLLLIREQLEWFYTMSEFFVAGQRERNTIKSLIVRRLRILLVSNCGAGGGNS
jgi:hypothetical protein